MAKTPRHNISLRFDNDVFGSHAIFRMELNMKTGAHDRAIMVKTFRSHQEAKNYLDGLSKKYYPTHFEEDELVQPHHSESDVTIRWYIGEI